MTASQAKQFFPTLQGDKWALRQAVEISTALRRDPVYRAMGAGLRDNMIGAAVMGLVVSTCDVEPSPSTARFANLFLALRQHLLPEDYAVEVTK